MRTRRRSQSRQPGPAPAGATGLNAERGARFARLKSSAELVESDFDAQATKKPRITRIICEVCQVQLPDWEKYYLHVLTTQHKDMAKTFDAVLKKCATIEIMDSQTLSEAETQPGDIQDPGLHADTQTDPPISTYLHFFLHLPTPTHLPINLLTYEPT